MNRLLKSSKFWLAVIGSIFGVASFILTGSTTISVMILSAFGLGIAGNAAEDVTKLFKDSVPGGGVSDPTEECEEGDEDCGK